MPYTVNMIKELLQDEREWADKVLAKADDSLLDWEIPNTPYTVSWLLWHIGETHHWVNHGVLKMKKEDGEPIGYPKWEKGKTKLQEYISIFKKESEALESTVATMTEDQLNTKQKYLSMFGDAELPVGQIVIEDIFHVIGHLNVISFARGLRGRINGEQQKWPPY